MKNKLHPIAAQHGYKTNESFYKDFPTEEAYSQAYPEIHQQMCMGGAIMKKGGWIKGAVNPSHKGFCTPMTKSTCTPRRKALARTFKKHHGFHHEKGGFATPSYDAGGILGAIGNTTSALSNLIPDNNTGDIFAKDALKYGVQGASLGFTVGGPIGAAIGGGVGLLGSGVDAIVEGKQKKTQRINDEHSQFLRNQPIVVNNNNPYGGSYEFGGSPVYRNLFETGFIPTQYEDGGQTDNTYINIQRGEGMIKPNQSGDYDILQDFNNPNRYYPHENNQMKEPHGNFINAPSDAIIIDKPNWKRFKNSDVISKNTIVRKILERQKDNPMQQYKMEKGGFVPYKKMDNGGDTGDFNQISAQALGNSQYNSPAPINLAPPTQFNGLADVFGPNSVYANPSTASRTPFNWEALGRTAKDVVPYLSDINQFIGSYQKDKIDRLRNPYTNQALSLLNQIPTNYDISSNLNANNNDYLSAVKEVNRGINPAVNSSLKANLLAQKLNANNSMYGTKINAENSLITGKNTTLANAYQTAGQEDTAYQGKYLDDLLKQRATQRYIRNSSLGNATDKFQQQQNYYKKLKTLGQLGRYFTTNKDGDIVFKGNPADLINFGG